MGADALFQSPPMLLASVIDLDLSFVIQLFVFLILYVLLSKFFFKPYSEILNKRDSETEGLRNRAAELADRAQQLEESVATRLEQARLAGNEERRKVAADGARIKADLIAQEQARLQAKVEANLLRLDSREKKFLESSGTAVDQIAELIETKIAWKDEQ